MGCNYEGVGCAQVGPCAECDFYVEPREKDSADLARHMAEGDKQRRETDYDALHKQLQDEAKHLKGDYLKELIYTAKVLRFRQGHSESPTMPDRPDPTVDGHVRRTAPHGCPEGFDGTLVNPIPLDTMKGGGG